LKLRNLCHKILQGHRHHSGRGRHSTRNHLLGGRNIFRLIIAAKYSSWKAHMYIRWNTLKGRFPLRNAIFNDLATPNVLPPYIPILLSFCYH
jgi:hypothetical protein